VLALARVVLEQAHIQALLTHIYPHIAIHADPPWLTPHRAQPTLYASSLRFCAGLQLPSDFPTACLPHTGLIYQPNSSVSGPGQSHLCVAVCRSLYMGPGMPARALSSRSYLAGQVQPRSIPGNSGVSLMPVPPVASHLPELLRFMSDLLHEYESKTLADWPTLSAKTHQFFSPQMMDKVDSVIPGWRAMAAEAEGATLVHVVCVFVSLLRCPEYLHVA